MSQFTLFRTILTSEIPNLITTGKTTMAWLLAEGCGFVGTNLADALLSKGESGLILDKLIRVGSRDNLPRLHSRYRGDWRFAETDVRDAYVVAPFVRETKPEGAGACSGSSCDDHKHRESWPL